MAVSSTRERAGFFWRVQEISMAAVKLTPSCPVCATGLIPFNPGLSLTSHPALSREVISHFVTVMDMRGYEGAYLCGADFEAVLPRKDWCEYDFNCVSAACMSLHGPADGHPPDTNSSCLPP